MFWLGIKLEGKLVSVGNTRFVDFASNIGVVATDEYYRGREYATSIVSALVKEIWKKVSDCVDSCHSGQCSSRKSIF